MKKILISGAFAFMLIIGFAHESYAQVDSTTTVVLSDADKATLIATLTQEIHDLLLQLIAQLQLDLQAQIANQVTVQIASSTQATTAPVLGSINTPMANTTSNSVDVGNVSVHNGKGTVPLVINMPAYVSGVARVKAGKEGGSDYGVTWASNGTVPQFEALDPDTYSFSIRLYNKPYSETNQGTTTDFLIEKTGTFVVPAQ